MPFQDIKQAAYEANMQLPELGLVLFTFGNASAADREKGVFAIKPSGVPYKDLRPEDMVIVDFNGNVVEGNMRPSSDTKTHAVLYKHWENISAGSCIPTRPMEPPGPRPNAISPSWEPHMRIICTVDIPCAPPMADSCRFEGNYEYETGLQIFAGI